MLSLIGRRSAARALAAVVGLIAVQACASSGHVPNGDATTRSLARTLPDGATQSESARITTRELRSLTGVSALEAVRRLRPEYLMLTPTPLAPSASPRLSVYQDGSYFGDAELLAQIPVELVIEVRRLTESRARQLYGWRCPCEGGVITVQTRR